MANAARVRTYLHQTSTQWFSGEGKPDVFGGFVLMNEVLPQGLRLICLLIMGSQRASWSFKTTKVLRSIQ